MQYITTDQAAVADGNAKDVGGQIVQRLVTRADGVSLAMATNTDSQVILDSAGAELLTPPGQAIVRRGAEMVTVMTPLLASAALDQYLARVRFGSVELTGLEKRVLQAAHKLVQEKKKPGNHAIHALVGGNYNPVGAACKRLRQLGLIVGNEITLPPELLPATEASQAGETVLNSGI